MNSISRIKNFFVQNQIAAYGLIFFLAFLSLLWVQSNPTFMDPDSFYHLKITKLIAQNGPVINFPYLQFTVLKNFYIDHHFLFHVAAIPFVILLGDFLGFKFYIVCLGTIFITIFYFFLKKDRIMFAAIWPLILLCDISFLFRVSLAKAVAFSLIILFLILYALFHKKYWWVIFLSFIYVWSYGGFMVALILAIIYATALALEKTFSIGGLFNQVIALVYPRKISYYLKNLIKNIFSYDNIKIMGSVALGLALGLVINLYFPKNIQFVWQQLVEIGIKNYQGAVNVGSEWHPYEIGRLFDNSGSILIFGVLGLMISIFNYQKLKAKNYFSFMAAVLFLLMTLKSQRYVEYFIPFAVLFSAYSFSLANWKEYIAYFKEQIGYKNLYSGLLVLFMIYIIAILPITLVVQLHRVQTEFKGGNQISQFEGVSNYLLKNSKPGEIIFHSDWDDFPALFYHNSQNYYIVGLDPTFMYKYDPVLYDKYADITTAKQSDFLYQDVRKIFKASYVIVDRGYDKFETNLKKDGHFQLVYQDDDAKIFKIMD